jgi:aspartyl-tRNA(Asn)/glutamyl-tRNA(Gln) amidotransferase subunit C
MQATIDIQKLAKLSRLEVGPEAEGPLTHKLEAMLGYMESLRELDLEGVEPMASIEANDTVLRADEPTPGLTPEVAFANAPQVENNHFVIPKVM